MNHTDTTTHSAQNPASGPHGTTMDQISEMENEGQAAKPGQAPNRASRRIRIGSDDRDPQMNDPNADDAMEAIRTERIAVRAYELFSERNGGDGDAVADWLEAERQIDSDNNTRVE